MKKNPFNAIIAPHKVAIRNIQPVVTFETVIDNRDSESLIRCITTHMGVSRVKITGSPEGHRFSYRAFVAGQIYRRKNVIMKPDFWVLN
tara:strand:+ start:8972 stop:9238 length:267 start_codon:yes stop_codon:yes gene_type:complete